MNKHLKNWLEGVSQALVLYPDEDYQYPQRGDFKMDATMLRSDVAEIAKGLYKNVTEHGKNDTRLS